MASSTPDERCAEDLRGSLVEGLVQRGSIRSAAVEAAIRAVARHRFAPLDATLESAYADAPLAIGGSSDAGHPPALAAPGTCAELLERAQLRTGHRVLVVGAGGYLEALAGHIVGDAGRIVSLEADERLAAWTCSRLAASGYRAEVVHGEIEHGVPALNAPFDRIIVTIPTPDVPAAWLAQLAADGLLVAPLTVRQEPRLVAFGRNNGHLESRSAIDGWTTPLRAAAGRTVALDGAVCLRFEQDPPADPAAFAQALDYQRAQVPTAVQVSDGEPYADLHLFLRASLPTAAITIGAHTGPGAVDPFASGSPAMVCADGSFAYLAARAEPSGGAVPVHTFEVHGHGPSGRDAAEVVAQHVRTWARFYRDGAGPVFHVYGSHVPDSDLPEGFVIDTPRSRVVLVWSATGRTRRPDLNPPWPAARPGLSHHLLKP
jgi:protein-L-isoaspartate(D-aspartate) O-methyltransferase